MAILCRAEFSVTIEIYAQASSQKTRHALKRLGESLDQQHFSAAQTKKEAVHSKVDGL
jgi:hypothetical protein